MNYACSAGIGAVSGLRTMSGPALVSEAAREHRIDLSHTPLQWLGSRHTSTVAAVLAAGELIADKLPSTPSRTIPPSLMVRTISGAVCGYAVCGKSGSKSDKWLAAALGAAGALAASYAGLEYRKRVKLPKFIAALAEDAFTFAAGAAVIRAIGR
jgi:uncharacterized membrane protein